MQLLDPKNDVVFKLLFAHPDNEDLLRSMIAAVLRLPAPVESVVVLNPGLVGELGAGKAIVLDLRVRLADGTLLDIEMETQPRPVTPARFLYYWARLHASQLERGGDYRRLRRTVSILWLDGVLPAVGDQFHSTFHVREETDNTLFTDQLELHLLTLPNLREDAPTTPLVRWARFLLAGDVEKLHALAAEDATMSKAVNELERLSADPMTKEMIEGIRRAELFRQHEMWEAREEGREQASRTIARALIANGMPAAQVADVTGLGEEAVRTLLAQTDG